MFWGQGFSLSCSFFSTQPMQDAEGNLGNEKMNVYMNVETDLDMNVETDLDNLFCMEFEGLSVFQFSSGHLTFKSVFYIFY